MNNKILNPQLSSLAGYVEEQAKDLQNSDLAQLREGQAAVAEKSVEGAAATAYAASLDTDQTQKGFATGEALGALQKFVASDSTGAGSELLRSVSQSIAKTKDAILALREQNARSVAIIGLGRMGAPMAQRLAEEGHRVIAVNKNPETVAQLQEKVAAVEDARPLTGASNIDEMIAKLREMPAPRTIWLMIPSDAVDSTLAQIAEKVKNDPRLKKDLIIVDGGNSDFRLTEKRAKDLAADGVNFIDVGTSGGVWGYQNGYGLMVGGANELVNRLAPVFDALAKKPGNWAHVGVAGHGHEVKGVHNAVEYGMMQSIAEGVGFMLADGMKPEEVLAGLNVWGSGGATVVRSWLVDLAAKAFENDPKLEQVSSVIGDNGEGRWILQRALDLGVPMPALSAALTIRFASQGRSDDANKVQQWMRNLFGGHKATLEKGQRA